MNALLFDTDIGTDIDDALALIVLARLVINRPFTVVTTNGPVKIRAQAASTLLQLLHRQDVQVFRGKSKPLSPMKSFTHGKENLGVNGSLKTKSFASFSQWLNNQEDKSITLIVTAPLTTVAFLLKQRSGRRKIKEIILMGGSFLQPQIPAKEHNLAADPIAARFVLSSGIPIFMVPLNATIPHNLSKNNIEVLRSQHLLLKLWIDAWLTATKQFTGEDVIFRNKIFLHDPLTVAVAFNRDQCEWEKQAISINSDGSIKLGGTNDIFVCRKISQRLGTRVKNLLTSSL